MGRFQKATRDDIKLRLALIGPSGSGKTFTALALAHHLLVLQQGKVKAEDIAVLDSEQGSAKKYADGEPCFCNACKGRGLRFDFCHDDLHKTEVENYIDAILDAGDEGFPVLIVDSLSHGWQSLLERVDEIAKAKYRGNTWSAWSDLTPLQNELVDAILGYPGHIICCMRSKSEWVIDEDSRGKKRPTKVGTKAVQRDDLTYEFDLVGRMTSGGYLTFAEKTRCRALEGRDFHHAGADLAEIIYAWMGGKDLDRRGQERPKREHPPERKAKEERRDGMTQVTWEGDPAEPEPDDEDQGPDLPRDPREVIDSRTPWGFEKWHGESLEHCHPWQAYVCEKVIGTQSGKELRAALVDQHGSRKGLLHFDYAMTAFLLRQGRKEAPEAEGVEDLDERTRMAEQVHKALEEGFLDAAFVDSQVDLVEGVDHYGDLPLPRLGFLLKKAEDAERVAKAKEAKAVQAAQEVPA